MLYPGKCPAADAETARIFNSKYVQSINQKYKVSRALFIFAIVSLGERQKKLFRLSWIDKRGLALKEIKPIANPFFAIETFYADHCDFVANLKPTSIVRSESIQVPYAELW